jgi:predicted NUDIX family NTP pyrophosphohydrolase
VARSAGLLLHRGAPDALEVWIAHMGGPFWRGRDRAWTIPKGEFDPAVEHPLDAALREFREETGSDAPVARDACVPLGEFRQRGGKIVTIFAAASPTAPDPIDGERIRIEWPPRSGRTIEIPELDEARWVPLADAKQLVVHGQVAALDALAARTPGG